MGVRKGDTTPVAIILLPAGSFFTIGRATISKTLFWKGNRQPNTTSSVRIECKSRRRNSRRWAISLEPTMGSSCGALPPGAGASGIVTFHRGVGAAPGGVLALLGRVRSMPSGVIAPEIFPGLFGGAPHLLSGQFPFKLFVEIAEHGPGAADPQADAAGQARHALRPEDHQRQQEDEREFPEAALEHPGLPGQCLSLLEPSVLPEASPSPSCMPFLKLRTALPRSSPILGSLAVPNTSTMMMRMSSSFPKPKPSIGGSYGRVTRGEGREDILPRGGALKLAGNNGNPGNKCDQAFTAWLQGCIQRPRPSLGRSELERVSSERIGKARVWRMRQTGCRDGSPGLPREAGA